MELWQVCLCLWLATAQVASAAPLGEWADGSVANFGGPADQADPTVATGGLLDGACGYGLQDKNSWPNWRVAAISPLNPVAADPSRHPLLGCGSCWELECVGSNCAPPGGAPLIVQAVDVCSTCPANRFIIPYSIFQQYLTNPGAGEASIRYRQVECDPPQPIVLNVDTYRATQGGYIRLSLDNVAGSGSVSSVELRKAVSGSDGSVALPSTTGWQRMSNTYGAKWEASGLPQPPLDVRITGDDGQILIASGVINTPAPAKYASSVQFKTAEKPGEATGESGPSEVKPPTPPPPPPCNDTVQQAVASIPELSLTSSYIRAAGLIPALTDNSQPVTFFAPTNAAWAALPSSVDINDRATLQQIMLYLVVQGPVSLPASSTILPEDNQKGGVKVPVDTLSGKPLTAVASTGGVTLQDLDPQTPDANIIRAVRVCNAIVNLVDSVPLPL